MLRPMMMILSLLGLVSCGHGSLHKSSFFVGQSHDQSIAGWFGTPEKSEVPDQMFTADTVDL